MSVPATNAGSRGAERIAGALRVLQAAQDEGLHVGAQVSVRLGGRSVADVAMGAARAGVDMAVDTLVSWFSCTKLATAVALLQQWERGEVDLDDPLVAHLPELAGARIGAVTVRHVLTHTAGLRGADGAAGDVRRLDWDGWLQRLSATGVEEGWVPGRRAGYHERGSFVLLGEIVRRLDGRPFERYVRQEVFEPLGMGDSWLALPPERVAALGGRIGTVYDCTGDGPRVVAATAGPEAHERCQPAASGIGPAADLVRLVDALSRGGGGVLGPQTAEAMVSRHRVAMLDETFGAVIDWGLGAMVNSWYHRRRPAPYGYGEHASARAFGHGGSQTSLAFADPEHGLAVAVVCNGMPGEPANHRRTQPAVTALYDDLGLR